MGLQKELEQRTHHNERREDVSVFVPGNNLGEDVDTTGHGGIKGREVSQRYPLLIKLDIGIQRHKVNGMRTESLLNLAPCGSGELAILIGEHSGRRISWVAGGRSEIQLDVRVTAQ